MKADEKLESYEITDYHRLKYLGDDLNEVLTLLLKGMRAGVGLFEVSKTIRALYLNEAYFECIGYTQEEYAEKEENVIFGGRLGDYKYYDMDKVVAAALAKLKEM